MTPGAVSLPTASAAAGDCWNRIGVHGAGTCPELPRVTHCRNCPVFTAAGQSLYERRPPAGYTEEWTERIAAADVPPPARTIPVVIFRVGGELLALDVGLTVEVGPVRPVRRVPHQSDEVLIGLVNIRGELQIAVSLANLLRAGEEASDRPNTTAERLLVAEKDGVRWVFPVDEVHDVYHFRPDDLVGLPSTIASGTAKLTRGVFRWGNRAVGYLDPDRLFHSLRRSFR
ncbi:chemotaxis protein CheW [Fimbriiglobus ruber]|uniref:Chemotaxis signal transduction protein n=1 Tax=Fimbriiglobus ruber TaxID=1908690 RepID=A0A225D513_9BACT|nr:chemotaxis protein CheW [Fimbriiglobus ruber]OWK34734.1 Chemotaxis signal transduction protein [Fimbriiglobus ruber]